MQGKGDWFVKEPKSVFMKKKGQILEIALVYIDLLHIFGYH
jgi:hypothetical protein